MKNAILFSPSLVGHRQVYVFVLASVLRKLDYKIYIAGNFSEKLKSTFYLDKLKQVDNIFRIDTVAMAGFGINITNDEFVDIQKKYNINLTVFVEADSHISLFNSQVLKKSRKLQGRIAGIFLRPFYFYNKFKFIDKLRYLKRLRKVWRSDEWFFHEVLNRQFRLLDSSLYLDEYFVSEHKNTLWLPDVFQQYADKLVIEEQSEQRIWIDRLIEFKRVNKGRFFLLYFGAPQQRRGYNQLLKVAIEYNACFIHCGLRNEIKEQNSNDDELRRLLGKENRLFETNEYITDPVCIEYFFKSVNHLILPYIDFYGSSGVMLQALGYNIPVLVPDEGIIGYRVKKHNLGLTYKSGSFDEQFLAFIKMPKENFSESINQYMKMQSPDKLESVLVNVFNSGNNPG